MRAHGESHVQFTVAENLHGMLGLDNARFAQHVRIDGCFAEFSQPLQADNAVFLTENVREAALRHAPVQRHLAAFKSANHARTRTRALPLVSAGGSLTHARAHTASYALALGGRLLRFVNIR